MRRGSINKNQDGFAAIVIAMVLIVVLGLMTVGFAQLMRREQESALDKHLSNQAYYAAEAGINDAAKAITEEGYDKAVATCDGSDVDGSLDAQGYLSHRSVGSSGVGYTCLLLNPFPSTLEYSSVDTENAKVILLTGVDPAHTDTIVPINKLYIGWQDDNGGQAFASGGTPSLATANNWNYTGMLRMNLTPLKSGFLNRQSLTDNNFAAYLYPNDSSPSTGSYSYNDGTGVNGGALIKGQCNTANTPRFCGVEIKDLSTASYALTLRSVYKNTRVTIKAYTYGDTPIKIKNAQTLVDSTGKAEGVLRRVQVRIPTHNGYTHPDYDMEALNGICKQLQLQPTSGSKDCSP